MNDLLKKVFSSETKNGRVMRTLLQAFIALTSGVGALLAVPELTNWFASLPLIVQLGGLSACVAFVSFVQNYAKDIWLLVKG